jgi:uncharacterized protein
LAGDWGRWARQARLTRPVVSEGYFMESQNQLGSFITGSPAPTQDEKTMAMMSHIGGIVLPILVPLFIMMSKGKESAWVESQSREALNFQITVMIAYVLGVMTSCIGVGVLLMLAAVGGAIVLGVLAGMKVNEGQAYRYPFTLRLVK